MYLKLSEIPLLTMINAARTGSLAIQGREIGVQSYYIAPDVDVEIFDRILENDLDPQNFVMAEFAGLEPIFRGDNRRYRRYYQNLQGVPKRAVTIASSRYWLRPLSAIVQSKRDGDFEGLNSLTFRIVICDTENREGLQAFLLEDLSQFENQEMKLYPEQEKITLVRA